MRLPSFRFSVLQIFGAIAATAGFSSATHAGFIFNYVGSDGLSAQAEFTMINATTLQVRLQNTSTGVPSGFSNSDQLLTGVSWDFGPLGAAGNAMTGGSAMTGANSQSINFSVTNVGPNEDISGEWGFGNGNGTGLMQNFISGNQAQNTPFGGPNLDGPSNLDGPQGGLVANPILIPLGGLGAISNEIIATVTLNGAYTDSLLLADLLANGTRVEFGSDAAFVTGQLVPTPGALALLVAAAAVTTRRRRS